MERRNAEKPKTQTMRGDAREPELHVGGGGDHLGSDGDGDGEPVASTGDEAGPLVKVEVSVDAEGTGGGMSAG